MCAWTLTNGTVSSVAHGRDLAEGITIVRNVFFSTLAEALAPWGVCDWDQTEVLGSLYFLTFYIPVQCDTKANFQTGSKNQLCWPFVLTLALMISFLLWCTELWRALHCLHCVFMSQPEVNKDECEMQLTGWLNPHNPEPFLCFVRSKAGDKNTK